MDEEDVGYDLLSSIISDKSSPEEYDEDYKFYHDAFLEDSDGDNRAWYELCVRRLNPLPWSIISENFIDMAFFAGHLQGMFAGWKQAMSARGRLSVTLGTDAVVSLEEHPQAFRVIALLAAGKTYEAIGRELRISAEGVRFHVKQATRVLGLAGVRDLKRLLGCPLRQAKKKAPLCGP